MSLTLSVTAADRGNKILEQACGSVAHPTCSAYELSFAEGSQAIVARCCLARRSSAKVAKKLTSVLHLCTIFPASSKAYFVAVQRYVHGVCTEAGKAQASCPWLCQTWCWLWHGCIYKQCQIGNTSATAAAAAQTCDSTYGWQRWCQLAAGMSRCYK